MSLEQPIQTYVQTYGYWALFVGTFLEGEMVLVLAGLMAHAKYLNIWAVIGVAFAGSLLGDQFFFFLGRWKGKPFLEYLGRRLYWQPRIERAHVLLERHHTWILLTFRFLYGLRSVIPFVVGAGRVRVGRFILLNVIGGIVWAAAIGTLGYLFGEALRLILADVRRYELWVLLALAAVGLAVWIVRLVLGKRRAAPAGK